MRDATSADLKHRRDVVVRLLFLRWLRHWWRLCEEKESLSALVMPWSLCMSHPLQNEQLETPCYHPYSEKKTYRDSSISNCPLSTFHLCASARWFKRTSQPYRGALFTQHPFVGKLNCPRGDYRGSPNRLRAWRSTVPCHPDPHWAPIQNLQTCTVPSFPYPRRAFIPKEEYQSSRRSAYQRSCPMMIDARLEEKDHYLLAPARHWKHHQFCVYHVFVVYRFHCSLRTR